jgi:hypothetical protein
VAKKAHGESDALAMDQPAEFLRRERLAQQVGVVLLTIFVVAGLAGLFGNGPLAEAEVTAGAVTVRFERFARQSYRTHVEISVTGIEAATVHVTVPRAFLDNVDVLEVRPPDTLKRLEREVAIFELPSNAGAATLVLHYEAKSYGVLEADVAVNGQPPAHLRQIVFF